MGPLGSVKSRVDYHCIAPNEEAASGIRARGVGKSLEPVHNVPHEARMSANSSRRPIVLNVVTSSCAVRAMQGQLQYLRDNGFDAMVISPAGKQLEQAACIEGVSAIEVPMVRKIAPLSDLVTLWRLWCIMRALRPTITNVGTPKAGL